MRKILLHFVGLFIGCLVACSSNTSSTHERSADELCKQVFKAIQQNDYEAYKALVVTEDAIRESSLEESIKNEMISHFQDKELVQKAWEEDANKFQRLQKVDWKNATLQNVRLESEMHNGVEAGNIYLAIKKDGDDYEIKLDDCIKLKKGWHTLFEGLSYHRITHEEVDTTMMYYPEDTTSAPN